MNRQKLGLGLLQADLSLRSTSDMRAEEISEKFSHTRPDGSDFYTAGNQDSYGEALARYYADPESLVTAWMNSPTHRAIMTK